MHVEVGDGQWATPPVTGRSRVGSGTGRPHGQLDAVELADAAPAGGDSLAKTEAGKRVDDPDAFYVASVDLGGVMTRLEQGQGGLSPSDRQIVTVVSKMDLWKRFRDRPFNVSYILDDGVRLESSMAIGPSTLVLLGVGMSLVMSDEAPSPELPTRVPVQQP